MVASLVVYGGSVTTAQRWPGWIVGRYNTYQRRLLPHISTTFPPPGTALPTGNLLPLVAFHHQPHQTPQVTLPTATRAHATTYPHTARPCYTFALYFRYRTTCCLFDVTHHTPATVVPGEPFPYGCGLYWIHKTWIPQDGRLLDEPRDTVTHQLDTGCVTLFGGPDLLYTPDDD